MNYADDVELAGECSPLVLKDLARRPFAVFFAMVLTVFVWPVNLLRGSERND